MMVLFRKLVTVLLLMVLCGGIICAADVTPVPEPYDKKEFPQWVNDLTRFGLIAIGTLPFTTIFIELGYKEVNYWPYVPFSGSVALEESEQKDILLWSVYASLGCAVVDFAIQKLFVQRADSKRIRDAIHGTIEIEEIEEFSAPCFKVSDDVIQRELRESGGTLLPVKRL